MQYYYVQVSNTYLLFYLSLIKILPIFKAQLYRFLNYRTDLPPSWILSYSALLLKNFSHASPISPQKLYNFLKELCIHLFTKYLLSITLYHRNTHVSYTSCGQVRWTYMMNCSDAHREVYGVLQAICPFFVSFPVTLSFC